MRRFKIRMWSRDRRVFFSQCKPSACVSLAGPDLISQDQTLSPTDTASMHNRNRPFVPNAAGQSPHLSPPFLYALEPQLYTQIFRHSGMQKSTHRKTLTPSPRAQHLLHVALCRETLPCYESGGDCNQASHAVRDTARFYFYQEAIKDNSEISPSVMEMYAALIVLIKRQGACMCVCIH